MKESVLKTFWRDTYQGESPIPFIISAQVILFVLIHLFDLLQEVNIIQIPLYDYTVNYFSLPFSFTHFLKQPWSILTYSFLYTGLFQLVFDCLWLYWIGTIFMNFLNKRQFLFLYFSAVFIGACVYLLLGTIPVLQHRAPLSFHNASFALAALIAAVATLTPQYELRFVLLGSIRLKFVALFYIAIELIFTTLTNEAAGVGILISACWGLLFIRSLQQGKDLSRWTSQKERRRAKMKVVQHQHTASSSSYNSYRHVSDLPNQEEIDEILDKISVSGYESLSSREKEVLFKASKDDR